MVTSRGSNGISIFKAISAIASEPERPPEGGRTDNREHVRNPPPATRPPPGILRAPVRRPAGDAHMPMRGSLSYHTCVRPHTSPHNISRLSPKIEAKCKTVNVERKSKCVETSCRLYRRTTNAKIENRSSGTCNMGGTPSPRTDFVTLSPY